MAAGCTGVSPGASKELVPKILVPCCSHFLGLETPEEKQGDYSCTKSGKFGVGGVTWNQKRISLSCRSHEDCRRKENF